MTNQQELTVKYFPIDQHPTTKDVIAACNVQFAMNPIQSQTVPQNSSEERCVVLCLDQSGSMAGSNFESLKTGAIQVAERAFNEQICDSIYTIFYHKQAELQRHESMSKFRSYVNSQYASGMTNFSDVYDKISRILRNRKKSGVRTKDLSVIFFTDGNDTVNPKMAISKIPELRCKIQQALEGQGESQFFAIGFTSEHDATLLNKLVKIGTQTGGFFYIPSNAFDKGAAIKQYLNDCWTLMGSNSTQLKAKLNIPSINFSTQIRLKAENVGSEGTDTRVNDDDDDKKNSKKQQEDQQKLQFQGKNIVYIPNNDQDDVPGQHKSQQKFINFDAAYEQHQQDQLQQQQNNNNENQQEQEEKKESIVKIRYESNLFVSIPPQFLSNAADPLLINLEIDENHIETVLTLIQPTNLESIRRTLDYINLKVFQCISYVQDSTIKSEKVKQVQEDLQGYDQRLNQVITNSFKIRGPMRKECLTDSQVIKGRIREAIEILRLSSNRFSNEQIAKLNDLAYRGVHHQGLQKKIDTRALKNQPYFEKIENQLKDILSKYNFSDIRKKHQTIIEKVGNCPLTVLDTVETMEEKDCMCISLKISRPEAAVADPTKLIIRDVISTYMSANAFLDSASFHIEKDESAHGGFDVNKDIKLSEGVGRQSIGGVMPLYLFPEHWNLAKRFCPKVFGLMCTADVMGFSMTQYYVIPFLVLSKIVELLDEEKNQTEARQLQFDLVLETCIAIVRQKKEVRQEFEESVTKFLKEPLGRTVDCVQSIKVLMARLLTLNRIGSMQLNEDEKKKIFKFALEQEMRRMIKKDAESPERKQILTMLDPDWAPLIDGFINQQFSLLSSKNASEEEKLSAQIQMLINQKNLKDQEAQQSQKKEQGQVQQKKQIKLIENAPKVTNNKIQIQKRVNQRPWLKQFQNQKSDLKALFSSSLKVFHHRLGWLRGFYKILGLSGQLQIKDNEQDREMYTAVFLQNSFHPKNATRRNAIEKNAYFEIMTPENANQFYKATLTQLLQQELRARQNDMLTSLKSNSLEADSMKFAATQDIYLAAGLLKGKTWGGSLTPFYQKLQTMACPSAYNKIQMLIHGNIEGIILICDKGKRNPEKKAIEWDPNKINKKKFWRQNVYESKTMTQEEFMLLFPNSKKVAHKMWLINVQKVYHREAEKIANDLYPELKKKNVQISNNNNNKGKKSKK